MDLNYTPEDIAFRKQVRPWLEQNLPKKEIANLEERRARHRKLFEAGYLGMGWPEEYGGGARGPWSREHGNTKALSGSGPSLGVGVLALQCIVAEILAGLPR